jgi:hypothetical protein
MRRHPPYLSRSFFERLSCPVSLTHSLAHCGPHASSTRSDSNSSALSTLASHDGRARTNAELEPLTTSDGLLALALAASELAIEVEAAADAAAVAWLADDMIDDDDDDDGSAV